VTDARQRSLGVAALVVVMLLFSWGSTLVKLAETPGVTVAFWRMALCSVIWVVYLRLKERRWTSVADFKAALLPGIAFGLDIAAFFIGVTKTTVASAEFTASLTPIVVIPLAAVFFKERMRLAPLTFGVLSIAGLALLLFNAPPDGEFSWTGVSWIIAAVGLWSAYLLTSRQLRQGRSVAVVMAHITPIATVVTLPVALVVFPGTLFEVTGRSVVFISLLAVLTGTVAHGLMVYAQHSVPVGVISLAQVAQPALAVTWSVLFLGSSVVGIQIVGMAMVIAGIAAVTVATQRGR
jgi:drug/metabolite transporter (DMT)-like permease